MGGFLVPVEKFSEQNQTAIGINAIVNHTPIKKKERVNAFLNETPSEFKAVVIPRISSFRIEIKVFMEVGGFLLLVLKTLK